MQSRSDHVMGGMHLFLLVFSGQGRLWFFQPKILTHAGVHFSLGDVTLDNPKDPQIVQIQSIQDGHLP